METTPPPLVAPMIDAALRAAHVALLRRAQGLRVAEKADNDGHVSRYTNGDTQSEQIIQDTLTKALPGLLAQPQLQGNDSVGFIMEESATDASRRGKGLHFVIDPIDGTYGYSQQDKNNPQPWCVSIGLEKDGKTIASAIYEAAESEYKPAPGAPGSGIDPNHPRGRIYWATAEGEHAYRIEPPSGGFTVSAGPQEAYGESLQDGKWRLDSVPELAVNAAGATAIVGQGLANDASKEFHLGVFRPDYAPGGKEIGPYRAAMEQVVKDSGYAPQHCYCCVSSLLRVAEGNLAGYIHGDCCPWDESAARLIIEKSGQPIVQWQTPNSNGQRSFNLASFDPYMMRELTNKIGSMPNAPQTPLLVANFSLTPPERKPPGPATGPSRRGFLAGVLATAGGLLLTENPAKALAQPGEAARGGPVAPIDHLPQTLDDLRAAGRDEKLLLAITTVSGCDAVAYYSADDKGALTLQQHIDLYPTRTTRFEPTARYDGHTHDTAEHMRQSAAYHLPVRDDAGNVRGVVVLHAPTESYDRLQTVREEQAKGDMHETVSGRTAKLAMASHLLEENKELLLGGWAAQIAPKTRTFEEKRRYFAGLKDDFIAAIGAGSTQASHVQGVADLMSMTVDNVINRPGRPVLINDKQKALLHDVTVLHDVGKLQMSGPFLVPGWRVDEKEEGGRRARYFMGQNHNHPLFTLLALGMEPTEALTTAAHHRGLFRYTDNELKEGMGDDYAHYKILRDNVPTESLSPLSRFMRVCDVTEAATGQIGQKPLAHIIRSMAERAVTEGGDCNSIDADYLCMMLDSGMLKKYGEMRAAQPGGWKDPNGADKYNAADVEKATQEALASLRWQERKAEAEPSLRAALAGDPLMKAMSTDRGPAR